LLISKEIDCDGTWEKEKSEEMEFKIRFDWEFWKWRREKLSFFGRDEVGETRRLQAITKVSKKKVGFRKRVREKLGLSSRQELRRNKVWSMIRETHRLTSGTVVTHSTTFGFSEGCFEIGKVESQTKFNGWDCALQSAV
jgi:hypothetical protein